LVGYFQGYVDKIAENPGCEDFNEDFLNTSDRAACYHYIGEHACFRCPINASYLERDCEQSHFSESFDPVYAGSVIDTRLQDVLTSDQHSVPLSDCTVASFDILNGLLVVFVGWVIAVH